MQIHYDMNKNQLLVVLDGEIDHHSSSQIRTEIDTAIYAHMPQILIFDFQNVTFMDSSGIGLIMGRYKILKPLGSDMILRQPSPHIAHMLHMAGMERLAKIQINTTEEVATS